MQVISGKFRTRVVVFGAGVSLVAAMTIGDARGG